MIVAPDGNVHVFALSFQRASLPVSHAFDVAMIASGRASSAKVRRRISAAYFGRSTYCSAAARSASDLPPPAEPP